ncbi:conserved hypothetical protein [Leishmania major strain Friedlin]|uniref:Uncharacterized protein n=1 Tax=Leishmania major TaxID=5664 RepID=E9AD47_LEIMA|nr:conserved hypothetical protein [Leishmania major strain Friedlin]CAG9576670.1 hypothetical_protein_-_conserved [Leishmania major strain Friedlin]CBZ12130.1 conserved hypothetical protein [Leishmania major strain Friedlin]|eukprot:XP_003721876.1 conserved hypothetical protein [Leishmania major strain Friedlin]
MQNSNSSYPSQKPYRGRGITDGSNMGTPHSTYSQQNPPTSPLVFAAPCGGTPPQQQDPLSTSLHAEPLQMNYKAPLGRHNSRTLIEVEDSPIKVTCLTKGGARSPYMAPMPSDMAPDADRSGRHNPYTFSYSGSSSPMQVSTPTHSPQSSAFDSSAAASHRMQGRGPYGCTELPPADARLVQGHNVRLDTTFALPPEVVHRALKDRCRYIQFPANLPVFPKAGTLGPNANNGNNSSSNGSTGSGGSGESSLPIALFIGQVRFETTAAELLWLVHRTCGACASHLESRGAGCYLLYCKSEADLTLVRSLHKRILFDIGGVWLARTADEVDAMCEYIALDAPLLSKKARLPRDSMVVEELKADAINSGGRRGHGAGGGHGKRAMSNHSISGNRRGGGCGASAQGSGVDDMSQTASGDVRQQPMQQQQQQRRDQERLPTYEESAPPYPGYPPQSFGEYPLYK